MVPQAVPNVTVNVRNQVRVGTQTPQAPPPYLVAHGTPEDYALARAIREAETGGPVSDGAGLTRNELPLDRFSVIDALGGVPNGYLSLDKLAIACDKLSPQARDRVMADAKTAIKAQSLGSIGGGMAVAGCFGGCFSAAAVIATACNPIALGVAGAFLGLMALGIFWSVKEPRIAKQANQDINRQFDAAL